MRVALISSEFAGLPGSGGIGTYFDHLARGLVRAGCEVEIFTSGHNDDLPPRAGVVFHHLGNAAPPDFAVFAGLAFRDRHHQAPFDVLECGELKAEGAWAARWAREVGFVVRLHSPSVILNRYLDIHPSAWNYGKKIFFQITAAIGAWRRGLPLRPFFLEPFSFVWNQFQDLEECSMTRMADSVVVMNRDMQFFANNYWGIEEERIKTVPNPYLPENLRPVESKNSSKTIGFMGRLEPRKGILELAEALETVLPDFPDWTVKMAGSFTSSCLSGLDVGKSAQKKLARFGRQVVFEGRIDPENIPKWLEGIGICVFPSLWESFSYVSLEAAQAGKAIVASRTGAVSDILDYGKAGLIMEPGDARGLAKALRKLMADEDLRVKLGAAARRRFEQRFHPDRVMGEILEVYREAIGRARERRNRQNH